VLDSLTAIEVTAEVLTVDYAYDLEEWTFEMVVESTYSESAMKQSSSSFVLSFKDFCWDIGLQNASTTQSAYSFELWESFALSFTSLSTDRGDHCNGFTHELVYVDGPLKNVSGAGPDLSMFIIEEATHTITGVAEELQWAGLHTLKIKSTNGAVKSFVTIDSDLFTFEIVNPCVDSVVTQVDAIDLKTTAQSGSPVTYTY